jgi:folate-binding protein YgfZ
LRALAMNTPLLDHHRRVGAKLGEFCGCMLPEAFADWVSEWRAARESVALFDTNWHAILVLRGLDRVRYLNAIVSNDIRVLGEDQGALALLLNAQGHILFELEIYARRDELLVLTHASARELATATLDKYIIMDDVELEDATERLGTIAIEGPRAGAVVSEVTGLSLEGFREFAGAHVEVDGVPCFLVRRSHFGLPGAVIFAPRQHLETLWQTLDGTVHAEHGAPIGMKALHALHLEAGVPWFPLDFNDTVIPHEAVLENTHLSFTKGCYTGQEIVERVRSRGHVNRRRVRLTFSTAEPWAAGTKLRADGAEVGYVTSAAFSPRAGRAIGMGYLRREYISPGSVVELDGGTATVIA